MACGSFGYGMWFIWLWHVVHCCMLTSDHGCCIICKTNDQNKARQDSYLVWCYQLSIVRLISAFVPIISLMSRAIQHNPDILTYKGMNQVTNHYSKYIPIVWRKKGFVHLMINLGQKIFEKEADDMLYLDNLTVSWNRKWDPLQLAVQCAVCTCNDKKRRA